MTRRVYDGRLKMGLSRRKVMKHRHYSSYNIVVLLIFIQFVSACGGVENATPVIPFTPSQTAIVNPTSTKLPTETSEPTETPDPVAGWHTLDAPNFEVSLKYPANWSIYPAVSDEVGQATLLTSDKDLEFSGSIDTEIEYRPADFYVWLVIDTSELVPTTRMPDWISGLDIPNGQRLGIETLTLADYQVISSTIRLSSGLTFQSIYFTSIKGVIEISGGPLESEKVLNWYTMLQTIKIKAAQVTTIPADPSLLFLTVAHVTRSWQGSGDYLLPFEGSAPVTSGPGSSDTHKYGKSAEAIDFAVAYGSQIFPTKSGTVIVAQEGWNTGYGNYVVIEHSDGTRSLYAHLSEILVEKGENISLSEPLGKAGNSGNVIPRPTPEKPQSGTHLHFQVYNLDNEPIAIRNLVSWKSGCPPCSDIVEGTAVGPSRRSTTGDNPYTYQVPEGYYSQASYSGDCLSRPAGSVCIGFSDGYIWLVYDGITGWSSDVWEGYNIQIAHGCGSADYYHILGTNFVK